MTKYLRLCKGVSDKGILVPEEKIVDLVDQKNDWYSSTFYYNEEHKKQFEATGSVRGIDDVSSHKLYWDFDSKNPEEALEDTKVLVSRLNMPIGDPEIYYSGQKGFHVVVPTDKQMSPEQLAKAAMTLATGLKTLDISVYNASRILRVPGTKHQKTKLYKFPLTRSDIKAMGIPEIKDCAKSLDNAAESFNWGNISISEELIKLPIKTVNKPIVSQSLDLSNKPAHWRNYKWALAQGHFSEGERHQALMVIAATCRGLGYTKDITYSICRSAVRMQAERTGSDQFPKEELYENIIEQSIFSDNWEGGQYSPQNNPWLAKYCERMGIKIEEEKEEAACIEVQDMEKQFTNYAQNFEQNIVKTGIKGIDENVLFLASTHNGILGAPGAGKCLGKNTPVLMYDGTIKKVQDIQVNDLLMGDDSLPRKVLKLGQGRETLYKIHQANGDSYIVNESHILSLKNNYNKKESNKFQKDRIVDIKILDYLNESLKFKKYFKGYKVGVEFSEQKTLLDPYFLGLWLGVGDKNEARITNNNKEIQDYLYNYGEKLKMNIHKHIDKRNNVVTISLNTGNKGRKTKGYIEESLIKENLLKNKHIPNNYLLNSRINRLKLLAGLIDSDGHWSGTNYDFTLKSENLANQITWLSRSLGFKATIKSKLSHCYYKGIKKEAEYFRIYINGKGLEEIPVLLERKKGKSVKKVNTLSTAIKVEKLQVGDYYGFEIDGNHRFLLGDFTVTHNTAFSLEFLRNASNAGIHSVFLSLDMGLPMIYSKLVQRVTGMSFKEVMNIYREQPEQAALLTQEIKEQYKNVSFNFKSGLTVADIRTIIKNEQERTGQPIKLLITDYLECIAGPYTDSTANTGFICQQLKDLANELNICSVLLLQTQKHSTGEISDPLLSMRQIKGSSVIEQSCSTVLTLWREGYNPKTVEDDKYISFATVKNRFGSLWTDDFGWVGQEGSIHGLTEEERGELYAFKERKKLSKIADEKEKNGQWE